jgi:hypothetical protein
MSADGGVTVVAHGVHYAIIGVGVLGLIALLAPRFLGSGPTAPRDEHERRVLALRSAIAHGNLAGAELTTTNLSATTQDPTLVASRESWLSRASVLTTAQRVLLPLAVVSSAAAAGVHAAVGPAHFREGTLIGLFFACSALVQLAWAGLVAVHSSRSLLLAGALGNVAVIGLWATTRTLGLPGLLPRPEAVGPWDLACVGWELLVVVACVALVQSRGPLPSRLVDWHRWHPAVHWFVAGSVASLVALSLSGASA